MTITHLEEEIAKFSPLPHLIMILQQLDFDTIEKLAFDLFP